MGWHFKTNNDTPGSDTVVTAGNEYTLNPNNTNSGAMVINAPNTTDNYVFKTYLVQDPTGKIIFFKYDANVRTMPFIQNDQIITATLSGALSSGQGVCLATPHQL